MSISATRSCVLPARALPRHGAFRATNREVASFLNDSIDRLEQSAALIDVLAMKRQNLCRNCSFAFSSGFADGIRREVLEFIPVSDSFFDELEDMQEEVEAARRQRKAFLPLLAETREFAEDTLIRLIDEELSGKFEQARNYMNALLDRPICGFLSGDIIEKIQASLPSRPTRQDAGKIGQLLPCLDAEVDTFMLHIATDYRLRGFTAVRGRTSYGAEQITLQPHDLGIGISPYDGSVTKLFRGKDTKHASVDTAMRSLVHAIDSEDTDRKDVADGYTRQMTEMISVIDEAVRDKTCLQWEQVGPLLDRMYDILGDIGRGRIQAHYKIRAAFRAEAALRALNCYVPPDRVYLVPQKTAIDNLDTAKAHLASRRRETSDIVRHLQRKYASLFWFRERDRQRHDYLSDTVQRALEMLSPADPAERNYRGSRNILDRAVRSLPKTTYYGYNRARQRIDANTKMLAEIDASIASVLEQRDRALLFEWRRLLDKQTVIAEMLSTSRRSASKGREDYISYCINSAKGFLNVLLAREYVKNESWITQLIRSAVAKTGAAFTLQNAGEIIDQLNDAQRRFFPQNGVRWQKDGRRLVNGAIECLQKAIKASAISDDGLTGTIGEDFSDTQAAITGLNKTAMQNSPELADRIGSLTVSIRDNLALAGTDLAGRTGK
ncbi:MAG: hypothetical protein NTZ10_02485 [Candidatus Saganbacteria bacterium]|nr:hypothetical protein [Candidatus Saganbacteria bacterium]